MTDLKIAIIGCGLIGQKRMLALPKGVVRVVCDQVLERAQKLAGLGENCLALSDGVEAASHPDVDLVMIATINCALAPLALAAVTAGKHVLVEKPGAITAQELREVQRVAEQNGVFVRVGYNHRYHPAALKMKEIWDTGVCGPLMFLRARYGHGGRVGYDREWRADARLSGGGELLDQGVHLIDLAGLFLKDIARVEGHIGTYFWDMDVDDNAFISLRDSSGATAWMHASCSEWKNLFSFELYGRTGKLHWEGLGGSYGIERLTHYHMLPEMGPPDTTIYEFPRGDASWKVEMAMFFEDVKLGRQPDAGLIDSIRTLEVVEALTALSHHSTNASL